MATSKRNVKRKSKKNTSQHISAEIKDEVFLLIGIAVTILLFLCNFHIIGKVGDSISAFLFGMFGTLAYIAPVCLFFAIVFAMINIGNRVAELKLFASIILFLVLEILLAVISRMTVTGESVRDIYQNASGSHFSGGLLGGLLTKLSNTAIGEVGTVAVALIIMIVCLVILTEKSFFKGIQSHSRKVYDSAKQDMDRRIEVNEIRRKEREKRQAQKEQEQILRMNKKVSGVMADVTIKEQKKQQSRSSDIHEMTPPEPEILQSFDSDPEISEIHIKGLSLEITDQENGQSEVPNASESITAARKHRVNFKDNEEIKESHRPPKGTEEKSSVVETAELVEELNQKSPKKPDVPYKMPPISLLRKNETSGKRGSEKQLKETAMQLKQTLKTFGVNVTITDISQGPSVTRYELQPEMGVKVSKIVNLSDDIKLNLAATDIRIEAPIPGKAAIGIEVPNKENSMVALRDLLESQSFHTFNSNLSFAVGKDISGQTVVTDIAKMPHVLIAGATGSGKSVCINTLIMSILYKAAPDDVKMIMIDPKVVELSVYNGIPHLMIPVVTDPKKAAAALHWGVAEMTERYKKFEDMKVRDLAGYNKKVSEMTENNGEEIPEKLPQILIIVDELADLMMVAPGEVEESICRLAQLARAAGIHLVIATQRPSVDVITGLIKANMPSRIAFSVSSGVDSRTILDMNGAEKLLGKGDMLFYPQGYPKPVRVQGAFVSDKEVSDVVDFLKEQGTDTGYVQEIESRISQITSSDDGRGKADSAEERDVYFADAGRFMIEKDKASIGMLQRVYKIGFNRAARIMDQLSDYGVVGEEEGTKPRKVLMSLEQFEELLEEI